MISVKTRVADSFYQHRVDYHHNVRTKNGHPLKGRNPKKGDVVMMNNDYLSLAGNPDITTAEINNISMAGHGTMMSAAYFNGETPQRQLEKKFASFLNSEDAILSQSGWCANTGLIQSIADSNTTVYIDILAHMSLLEGIRSAGATAVPFMHNNVSHLIKQIRKNGPGIILVDSVYSTKGDIAPLNDLVEIARQTRSLLVVDESHSLGTHGSDGSGLVVEMGLENEVEFRTASLAKAFAGRGGIITCRHDFHDYFLSTSLPSIFSSALLLHDLAGFSKTIDVIKNSSGKRRILASRSELLRDRLAESGYNIGNSQSQIISLEPGDESKTVILRDALEQNGVFGSVFCSPATPKNRALIRFSLNSDMTTEEINRVADVCDRIKDHVGFRNWASTRKQPNRIKPLVRAA